MITTICVIYYSFCLLFMIGYTDYSDREEWWEIPVCILMTILCCWFATPVLIGLHTKNNR